MLYLVTFDLHGAPQPPGDLYSSIYRDIKNRFGEQSFSRDFGGFCLVKSENTVQAVKNAVKSIIDRKSNHFSSMDLVVFSVGDQISISRGMKDDDLKDFRKFFTQADVN